MELKKGFAKTELGVLPVDWEPMPLESFTSLITYGFTNPMPTSESGVFMITAKDINHGKIQFETARCTTLQAFTSLLTAKSRPKKGDILLTKDGTLGRLAVVDERTVCINQSVALIRPNAKASSKFLKYLLESPSYQKRMVEDAGGSTIKHIYITIVNRMLVAVPPSKAEQEAIAEVLSDADALIESLEQLLAKKRLLKQGAMQELLTGKRRLAGFNDEWEIKSLESEVEALDAGVSVRSIDDLNDAESGTKAILKTSCIDRGVFSPNECKRILASDIHRAKLNPRANTILISRMNTIDLVGECGFVDADYPNLFVPDRLWMTRFRRPSKISAKWLSYVLSSKTYRDLLKGIAGGTSGSMKNIGKRSLLSLELAFPSHAEQSAIATFLSDMDAEIDALESKLAKARQLKQGLMQELLTGRTRLV